MQKGKETTEQKRRARVGGWLSKLASKQETKHNTPVAANMYKSWHCDGHPGSAMGRQEEQPEISWEQQGEGGLGGAQTGAQSTGGALVGWRRQRCAPV